jgi:hypothetical protein
MNWTPYLYRAILLPLFCTPSCRVRAEAQPESLGAALLLLEILKLSVRATAIKSKKRLVTRRTGHADRGLDQMVGCASLARHRSIDERRIALASVPCLEPDKGQDSAFGITVQPWRGLLELGFESRSV